MATGPTHGEAITTRPLLQQGVARETTHANRTQLTITSVHANGTIDEHRIYYYLHNGVYKLRQGMSKTHDFWFEFGKPKAAAAVSSQQRVRMAVASPGWHRQTKVFGEISVPRPSKVLRQYDDVFAQTFAGYLRDRSKVTPTCTDCAPSSTETSRSPNG
ncbi:MAG: hypothetical protein FJW31_23465 [Acidobacteria bacterium]|nr:hypothetical protein [Acidobacteriota bacterium]